MHRNLVTLTALLAATALSTPALAWRQGTPPMCPLGTVDTGFNNIVAGSAVINVNNGCGPDGTEPSLTNGAPAPSPDTEQYSDLVTGYAQQSLALNLNLAGAVTVPGWTYQTNVIQANPYPFWGGVDNEWNIAGRDYPVGPRPAAYNICAVKGPTGLCDPATLPLSLGSNNGAGTGCTVSGTQVSCAGNPVNLDGYDFTMHGGMGLFLKPATSSPDTQTCNVEDSIFAETNTSATEPLTNVYTNVYITGCAAGFHFLYDRFYGRLNANGWMEYFGIPYWIYVESTAYTATPSNPASFSPADIRYSAFDTTPARPLSFSTGSCYWAETYKYNLFNGVDAWWEGNHGDSPSLNGCTLASTLGGPIGLTYTVDGNTFIQAGENGGGYLTGTIVPEVATTENMMFGAADIEQNTILVNLMHASGGPWDHISAVGKTMTIGDTSLSPASQQLWTGNGMYFYSDPSNGGVSINAGVTTSGSTVARGSIGAYLLDASETTAALGSLNGNLLFTTENAQGVQTASFYGYIVGGTPNIMYVTQLVSGAINPGSDTVTYNGTAVSDIWDADYASSVSLTTFGSWASPQQVTGANGTYTAYAPGGTALYVKNVSSGGIYFGDSFTTPVPQTGTISGSNIGAIGGGGGDIGLSATLYTNSGTTPVNSFTNKKIQAVYDPVGSLITLGNGLLGYAGSMTVANNRGDDTGSYAGNCLFMKAGNPMFAESPVMTGNASLLHAPASAAWTPTITHHTVNINSATFTAATGSTPAYLTLGLAASATVGGSGVLNLNGNGATGWPADWTGTFFIPPSVDGNPGNSGAAAVTTVTVSGPFTTTSATWSGATPTIDWYDGTMTCPSGGFHQ